MGGTKTTQETTNTFDQANPTPQNVQDFQNNFYLPFLENFFSNPQGFLGSLGLTPPGLGGPSPEAQAFSGLQQLIGQNFAKPQVAGQTQVNPFLAMTDQGGIPIGFGGGGSGFRGGGGFLPGVDMRGAGTFQAGEGQFGNIDPNAEGFGKIGNLLTSGELTAGSFEGADLGELGNMFLTTPGGLSPEQGGNPAFPNGAFPNFTVAQAINDLKAGKGGPLGSAFGSRFAGPFGGTGQKAITAADLAEAGFGFLDPAQFGKTTFDGKPVNQDGSPLTAQQLRQGGGFGGGAIPLDFRQNVQHMGDQTSAQIIGAALPGFAQNLQTGLGGIAATSPSTFNSALGLQQADFGSQALRDFNLFAGQAAQQGQALGNQRFASELGAQTARQGQMAGLGQQTQALQAGTGESFAGRQQGANNALLNALPGVGNALTAGGASAGGADRALTQQFINPILSMLGMGGQFASPFPNQFLNTGSTQTMQQSGGFGSFLGNLFGLGAGAVGGPFLGGVGEGMGNK